MKNYLTPLAILVGAIIISITTYVALTKPKNDMLNKNNQELRLKRTKPLPSSHNTLENCMNLTYVNS